MTNTHCPDWVEGDYCRTEVRRSIGMVCLEHEVSIATPEDIIDWGADVIEDTHPRLMRGPLTGRVFAVTEWIDRGGGRMEALVKHDVTDDFNAIRGTTS